MPAKTDKVSFHTMRSVFFFGLIIILGLGMLYLIRPFIYPIFWAAVFAVSFYPFYGWIKKHLISPGASSLVAVLMIVILVFLPLTVISGLVVSESIDIYKSVVEGDYEQTIRTITESLDGTAIGSYVEQVQASVSANATNLAKSVSLGLLRSAQQITGASLKFLVQFFIMIYTLYYFFKDGPKMLSRLMHLSPLGDRYEEMLYKRFTSTTRATLKSTLIIGGIQGTLSGILFFIAGIQGAFIWGIIMVIIAVIPAIGTAVILLPAAVIMLILGNFWQAIMLFVGAIVVGFIDNLLRPPLVGKDTQMHPLVVLFATLGGIMLFGVSGFIIGPIIAAMFISVLSIYDYYYRSELSNN